MRASVAACTPSRAARCICAPPPAMRALLGPADGGLRVNVAGCTAGRRRRLRLQCGASSQPGAPPVVSVTSAPARGADFIRPHLRTMAPYTPIVPFDVLSQQLGRLPRDIIKLDANENPYGPPPGASCALAVMTRKHAGAAPQCQLLPVAASTLTPAAVLSVATHPRTEVALALAKLEFPHIYPDPEARRLRAALAADCGVPAENLMAGTSLPVLSPLPRR